VNEELATAILAIICVLIGAFSVAYMKARDYGKAHCQGAGHINGNDDSLCYACADAALAVAERAGRIVGLVRRREMRLDEALRSGKKFRRAGEKLWHPAWQNGIYPFKWGNDSVLADDWEIEREPREFILHPFNNDDRDYYICQPRCPQVDGEKKHVRVREVLE
jgi:hypothetical protein